MLLWVILASLTAIVLFVLLRPLTRRASDDEPGREAFNATVYRDQLDEIEADRTRGLIGETEAEAARLEVARRLLEADEKSKSKSAAHKSGVPARASLAAVALALPIVAVGLYLFYGSPRLPDQPLAARLTDPASEKDIGVLVARVEARLRAYPEEGEGWDAIAPVYLSGQRYADAADAYAQAIRLLGPTAERLSGYGQALVLEKGGLVSEQARRALEEAVALDDTLVEPRILIAVAKEQDGNFAAAIEDWRGLLSRRGGDERWRMMVQKRIENAEAHLAGAPAEAAPPSPRGPSAAEVAAAQEMTAAERQSMVENMVQRLAARLDEKGDDLAGWLRLVRAYTVLGRNEEARKALARARSEFADNTQALKQLDALAAELGLTS